mmetsp:Transcript_1775/g.3720  ORF Transcript_1775/g.3720 Transcript_1775/m.3720 type:complete len:268 (+) Transcript_1775:525-1328(+)
MGLLDCAILPITELDVQKTEVTGAVEECWHRNFCQFAQLASQSSNKLPRLSILWNRNMSHHDTQLRKRFGKPLEDFSEPIDTNRSGFHCAVTWCLDSIDSHIVIRRAGNNKCPVSFELPQFLLDPRHVIEKPKSRIIVVQLFLCSHFDEIPWHPRDVTVMDQGAPWEVKSKENLLCDRRRQPPNSFEKNDPTLATFLRVRNQVSQDRIGCGSFQRSSENVDTKPTSGPRRSAPRLWQLMLGVLRTIGSGRNMKCLPWITVRTINKKR